MFCDRCGTKAREGARFCASCGADLPAQPERITPAEAVATPAPPRSKPPRSRGGRSAALGVALLDATGLGIGQFLLRRYLIGLLLLGGTLVAVGLGVMLPGPAGPLLVVTWLVASGVAGYLTARRYSYAGAAPLVIGTGFAALVLIVGLYFVYVRAADNAYASALDQHRRGDCASALDSYQRLDYLYGLSYRSFDRLDDLERECRSLKRLDSLDPNESGGNALYPRLLDGYAKLEASSLLIDSEVLEHRQAVTLSSWGDWQLRSARTDHSPTELAAAAQHYDRALLHESDYENARQGVATIAAVVLRSPICERAHQVEALAAGRFSSPAGTILRRDAASAGPRYLLACGRRLLPSDPAQAAAVLKAALKAHPHSPSAAATHRVWIKAEVAAARDAGSGHLPPPSPSGSAPSGTSALVVGNDSRYPIQVFLDGPRPTEFVVPACGSCSDYGKTPSSFTCGSNTPSHTVTLRPGRYSVEVKATGKKGITPFTGSWPLSSGVRYSHCLFVVVTHG